MPETALTDDVISSAVSAAAAVRAEVAKVYQGPVETIDALLIALVARGHILLEGVPGVAKTTLVNAFAEAIDAPFARIQFTPDLLPSDITGTHILDMRTNTFVLRRGPVFANVVLGDEINRAPPKTQAALLEAMQERQVTLEGETLSLPNPFFVLATQNPVEHEGVYVLPEAQLDRFLLKLEMGYPSAADEERMLREHAAGRPAVSAVLDSAAVLRLCDSAERVNVASTIQRYIVSLSRWTRNAATVLLGASPRASLALVAASRARALLSGRDYVTVEDVRALAPVVFAHRLIVSSSALLDGLDGASIVKRAIRDVPYDPA